MAALLTDNNQYYRHQSEMECPKLCRCLPQMDNILHIRSKNSRVCRYLMSYRYNRNNMLAARCFLRLC
ncbi:MAG: hypothetical protein ACTSYI_15535 [Promethearchaeota archaeon]